MRQKTTPCPPTSCLATVWTRTELLSLVDRNTDTHNIHLTRNTSRDITTPRDVTTTTPSNAPTKGWRSDLVPSWASGHTRVSRQDIHSKRVPTTVWRLWMAQQPQHTHGVTRTQSDTNHSRSATEASILTDNNCSGMVPILTNPADLSA